MTQQKRIAEEDLNRCKLNGGFIYDEVLPYWIKEAERMKAGADQLASESSSQFVSTTNALMRAEAAEQELEAQLIRADAAEEEAKHQEKRALRYSNDYHEACRYQLKYGRQAELAEQERDKLVTLLEKIETALEYHEWTDYMQYVSDEITAYREGSNTDAKRD